MTGDYHDVNKVALKKVERLLRGDFNEVLDAHDAVRNETLETKEIPVAKKKAGTQLALDDDWSDKVPEDVQNAADEYVASLRKKSSAAEKFNGAKTALIELMKTKKVEKVKVAYKDGEKIIELEEIERLHLRKPESSPSNDDEEGDDEE